MSMPIPYLTDEQKYQIFLEVSEKLHSRIPTEKVVQSSSQNISGVRWIPRNLKVIRMELGKNYSALISVFDKIYRSHWQERSTFYQAHTKDINGVLHINFDALVSLLMEGR